MASKNKKDYTGTIVSMGDDGEIVRISQPTTTNTKVTKVNSNTSNMVSKPTVETKQTVKMPTMNSQKMANKNYEDKLSIFNKASEDYDKKRIEELNKKNIDLTRKFEKQDFKNNIKDGIVNKKSVWEKEKEYEAFEPELQALTNEERKAREKAQNDLRLARYQKNVADVDANDVTLLDQITSPFTTGIGDFFSTITDENRYTDENGNVIYLPSKNDLQYQKVRDSYGNDILGNVARFGGDIAHELGKQAGTQALNMVTGGKGGSALYFSDIIADQYKQNINEGYDQQQSLVDAFLKGGSNYIKQKIIGGLGGKLTGGDASWLENKLTNTFAKGISNPRIVSTLSSMSAEALDEFTDTYIEAGIDAAILGKDFDATELFLDSLYSAGIGAGTGAGSIANVSPEAQQAVYNRQQALNNQNNNNIQNTVTNAPNIEQNTQSNVETTTQIETPQIDTKPQESINTQPTPQNVANDLKTTNNEVIANKPLESTRSVEDVSNRKVNAFQYDNPEVKPYFRDAALDLEDALYNYTTRGERTMLEDGTWTGTKFSSTPEITELKTDYKMSYDDIKKGLKGIIDDEGKENNAASKKIELVIDKMLRNGYRSEYDEVTNKPNQEYLDTLAGKKVDTQEEIEQENLAERKNDAALKINNDNLSFNQLIDKLGVNGLNDKVKEQLDEPNTYEFKDNKVNITGDEGKKYFMDNGVKDEKVAKILSEKPKQEKDKLKDTLSDVAGETYRLLVSKAGEVEKIAKVTGKESVKHKYDKSMRARSEAQQHIGEGQADLNYNLYKNFTDKNGNKVNMSLNDIREDAKNNSIPEQVLNEYLAHWLNVDRFQEGKPVFGNSVTSEISMQKIANLDKQYPQLNRIADNVWQFEHNELKNLYDSGLITENTYKKLDDYKHYVRIQRQIDKTKNNRTIIDKNGRISVNQPIQKAKGGNQDILPIMEGIASYTSTMLEAERMNEAVKELASAISVGSKNDSINAYENEESFGVNPEFVKSNDDGTYTMTYFDKGVAHELPINKAIYDAFVKNKAISAMENNKTFKAITYAPKKLSTMFRGLTTNYNPMFMVTNAFKDIGDAPFNSKYTSEFAKTYLSTEALRQVAIDGVYNKLYKRAGGQDDSYFTEGEFKDKAQSKLGKVSETLLTPITKGNEIVESVPRMAEFIATIKGNGYEVNQNGELVLKNANKAKGKTAEAVLDEALYNAAEVTTNFKRGGDLAKSINRNGGTFFNASIQGFDKQVRNFKDAFTSGDKKQIAALLTKALVFGIAPTMLNDAMNGDDDEYKEMQDYIKDNYYIFKGDNGTWIRIPKGRAMSVIGSAYRRIKDYTNGNKDAFNGFVEFASGQVAPNNPFENNIIAPFFAVANNKSWSGNKIISQSMEDKPTNEQYNEKTDKLSIALGQLLKDAPIPDNFKSPMGINYLIDQYTGGIGDTFLPMLTPKATGKSENSLVQPFISKFTSDADYSNKSVGTFYDTMAKLKTNKNSVNADKIDKLKYTYINSQNMKMAELKKEQSAIQNDETISNEEKYNRAKEIQKEINELAKKSIKDLDNIENNTYYAIVGDNIYYLNKDGTFTKDSYADSHKKSAEKQGVALYDYYKEQYEKKKEKED